MTGSNGGQLAAEWRERLCRYAITKRTISEFCMIEGVTIPSFYYWRKKLDREPTQNRNHLPCRSDFASVRLVGSSSASVIVRLPGGTRLEIPMCDLDAFAQAIDVVVSADARRAEGVSC